MSLKQALHFLFTYIHHIYTPSNYNLRVYDNVYVTYCIKMHMGISNNLYFCTQLYKLF